MTNVGVVGRYTTRHRFIFIKDNRVSPVRESRKHFGAEHIDEDLIETGKKKKGKKRGSFVRATTYPSVFLFRRRESAMALCPGYSPAGTKGRLDRLSPTPFLPPQGVNGVLAVKRQREGEGEGVEPAARGKPRMLALDGSSAGRFGWLG